MVSMGMSKVARPQRGATSGVGGSVAVQYFSDTYAEARAKFLGAAERAGAPINTFQHSASHEPPIFTDVAVLGSLGSQNALVLMSGTHGIEGFAGSAIQTGLLEVTLNVPGDLVIIMIHAINPYGFAHLRRANEDNVDLNRNFVDHTRLRPTNLEYGALASVLHPKNYSLASTALGLSRLVVYRAASGRSALQAAITLGQYDCPTGLFYGGQARTWSNMTLRTILKQYLMDSARVVFVDIHTGLGPYAHGEIITNEDANSPAYRRSLAWWGHRTKTTKTGEAVSADLHGTVKSALTETLRQKEITAVSLEFGTVPPLIALKALIAENWFHHNADPQDPRRPAVSARLRRAFYPNSNDWKEKVWRQAFHVVQEAIAGLGCGLN